MKEGLDAAGLKAHLMIQPLAYHTPDCGKQGFIDLPEFPFGKFLCVSSVQVHVHCPLSNMQTQGRMRLHKLAIPHIF